MLPMKRVYQRKKLMSFGAHHTLQDILGFFALPAPRRQIRLWPALALWSARRRTRRHLSTLDDRGLADVGLSQAQQRDECAKPFWQL